MGGGLSSWWDAECPEHESILRRWSAQEKTKDGQQGAECELPVCPGSNRGQQHLVSMDGSTACRSKRGIIHSYLAFFRPCAGIALPPIHDGYQ